MVSIVQSATGIDGKSIPPIFGSVHDRHLGLPNRWLICIWGHLFFLQNNFTSFGETVYPRAEIRPAHAMERVA